MVYKDFVSEKFIGMCVERVSVGEESASISLFINGKWATLSDDDSAEIISEFFQLKMDEKEVGDVSAIEII